MKKLLIAVCLVAFFASEAFAALGAATVWEIRTTGSANNGGGFDSGVAVPGTDYSQQDSAQDSGTDLACADGDAAAPSITSATHNFVAADEGNIINITETGTGFTLGRYLIVDTAANAATLDRACGPDGALTGGDWYLGGAVDHPNTISATVVAGNKIYVKAGTYVKVGANAFVHKLLVSGGNGTPIVWEGYNSARDDAPTGSSRVVYDGDSDDDSTNDTTNCLDAAGSGGNMFKNFWFKRASGDGIFDSSSGVVIVFDNCRSSNNTDDGISITVSGGALYCIGLELDNNSGQGAGPTNNTDMGAIINCYIHDNTSNGGAFRRMGSMYFSIIESNSADGISISTGVGLGSIVSCVFYNNTGANVDGFSYGVSSASGSVGATFSNNIFADNGAYGISFSAATATVGRLLSNCFNGNGSGATLNVKTALTVGTVTAAPSFTNAAGGDFTLTSSSPCLATGFPQAFPGATGDYQWNIGVDQDDNVAASGGGDGGSAWVS